MGEFNYKNYLKNNPLLTEEKISKENSDKLINYFSNLDDEDLNDTLRDLSSWGHELITKERHDNPMADRMFTNFNSVTRWILSIDDDLAKDILYAIQNDLAMPVEKGQYVNEDEKPKERNGMVWADEIDKWVTKEEYIEYLETRADDHFSEPLKEGYSLNPDEVELMTSLRNQIDQGVLNSKQKDSFVGMLDGILNGYDVFNGDLEDYYNKNMKGTNPENDPFNINEELEIDEEDHSMFNASILTLSNGETLEVDVIELMDNLVDNLDEPAMKLWNEFKDKMENR